MSIERYKRRLTAFGKSLREEEINKEKYHILQLAPDSPGYKQVEIGGVERNLLITSTQLTTKKTIYAMPGEDFDVGEIVFWNGSHWLITQRDLDNDIMTSGLIEQCNRQITWQNPQTREIFSLWATVEKPYYSNLRAHPRIEVSTREFKVQIPYTPESCLIDIGKRFMLEIIGGEPKTYRVVSVDSMTERYDRDGEIKGFIVLNLEQDLYNPLTDNMEKEVCDYIDENDALEEFFEEATITYNGNPTIKAGGSAKTFTGNLTTREIGQWIVTGDDLTGISWAVEGNTIKIKAEDDMHLVGRIIVLIFRNNGGSATAAIEIEVIG